MRFEEEPRMRTITTLIGSSRALWRGAASLGLALAMALGSADAAPAQAVPDCRAVVNGGSWDLASTWSCGVAPMNISAGELIAIPAGISVVIDGPTVVNDGRIRVAGTVEVRSQQILWNTGVVRIISGGLVETTGGQIFNVTTATIDNEGTLRNDGGILYNDDGTIDNTGTIENVDGGIVDNQGGTVTNEDLIRNEATLANRDNSQIVNAAGAGITNTGDGAQLLNNSGGEIDSAGNLVNDNGALMENEGVLYISGLVTVNGESTVSNQDGGEIRNSGNIIIYGGSTVENHSLIYNEDGGELRSSGAGSRIDNLEGRIINQNGGVLVNRDDSVLYNEQFAAIDNMDSGSRIENEVDGAIVNEGYFTNGNSALTNNAGYILNTCSGTIWTVTGTFFNNDYIANYGGISGVIVGNAPVNFTGC
jgi:hypothetical protein